jgi:hypothetical protein
MLVLELDFLVVVVTIVVVVGLRGSHIAKTGAVQFLFIFN